MQLEKLNSIVWPCIFDEVKNLISTAKEEIVVVEAAILLKAGWEQLCHEVFFFFNIIVFVSRVCSLKVWTTIIPEGEAAERLKRRNALTEQQVKDRIRAQPTNKVYVDAANVVFCSLWSVDFTYLQVDKAWKDLQIRINSPT